MARREKNPLTRLELALMQVIWKQGSGSVSDVQEGLEQKLAYTTVQTMLNILCRKGKLKRKLNGRAFVYAAAVTEDKALRHAVRDLVDRMFGGSSEELVMSLIKNRDIDARTHCRIEPRARGGREWRMTSFQNWALAYFVNSVWQVPLVFIGAWLAARIAVRIGPGAEHRIWVSALLVQISLPACPLAPRQIRNALGSLLSYGRRIQQRRYTRNCCSRGSDGTERAASATPGRRRFARRLRLWRVLLRRQARLGIAQNAPHRSPVGAGSSSRRARRRLGASPRNLHGDPERPGIYTYAGNFGADCRAGDGGIAHAPSSPWIPRSIAGGRVRRAPGP